jgi:hypothetical protein
MARLILHPQSACRAVGRIEVLATRPAADLLCLDYLLSGVTDALVLPPPAIGRADELWRHSCLEAFVQAAPEPGYRELNLSPSGQWAAYRFDGYRDGMANAEVDAPTSRFDRAGDRLQAAVTWRLDLAQDAVWRVGVTAVIEDAGGAVSYWALRHPTGRPDFHHADGFALELPPPSRP